MPFGFLFGFFAQKIGAKRAVFVGLAVYSVISVLGYFMRTATHFFVLAIMVGMVQGGTQALSRSLFASMIPKHKSSEFFAFFGVFERYAGDPRPGGLRLGGRAQRHQPERDPVGAGVLRRRRRAADVGRRG